MACMGSQRGSTTHALSASDPSHDAVHSRDAPVLRNMHGPRVAALGRVPVHAQRKDISQLAQLLCLAEKTWAALAHFRLPPRLFVLLYRTHWEILSRRRLDVAVNLFQS